MNVRVLLFVLVISLVQISMAVSAFEGRLRRSEDFIDNARYSASEPLFEGEAAVAIPPRRIRYYRTGGTILLG